MKIRSFENGWNVKHEGRVYRIGAPGSGGRSEDWPARLVSEITDGGFLSEQIGNVEDTAEGLVTAFVLITENVVAEDDKS